MLRLDSLRPAARADLRFFGSKRCHQRSKRRAIGAHPRRSAIQSCPNRILQVQRLRHTLALFHRTTIQTPAADLLTCYATQRR